jgi:acyl-coenzyme A thioesterase PaaI-like protein
MKRLAFQDYYADEVSHCYGCGRLNERGLQIKSFWEGDEAVCSFTPRTHFTAIPGIVYGGLIASLIDCHGTGAAAAAAYRNQGREMGTEPRLRFVTVSLHVDYIRPAPIESTLTIRASASEIKESKVVVDCTLSANQEICAKGKVVVVPMPEEWVAADR